MGWDCHGLLRFTLKRNQTSKKDEIGAKISIHDYDGMSRGDGAAVTNGKTLLTESGRWVELKGAYKTMDKEYMESIWWAFTTLYEKRQDLG